MNKTVPHDVAVSTAAMMAGFGEKCSLSEALENARDAMDDAYGCVEIYCAIADCAILSCELCTDTKSALPCLEHPGVYAYEVDEPFGAWFREYCVEKANMPHKSDALKKLGELTLEFHSRDIPPEQRADLVKYLEARTEMGSHAPAIAEHRF